MNTAQETALTIRLDANAYLGQITLLGRLGVVSTAVRFSCGWFVSPSNFSTIQDYDTRVPTNTASTGSSYLATVFGAHVYTSSTSTVVTACNLSPTQFAQNQSITVNALKCEPIFNTGGSPQPHLAPGTIEVYLPSSMSGATSALTAAINDWNSYLSGTKVQFSPVTAACTIGPACITVIATPGLGYCGFAGNGGAPNASNEFTGGMELEIHGNWSTFTSQSLQRTFAHELGHYLGLSNYTTSCGVNDAIMQHLFSCGPTAQPAAAVSYLPAVNSVYNGKSRKSCGF